MIIRCCTLFCFVLTFCVSSLRLAAQDEILPEKAVEAAPVAAALAPGLSYYVIPIQDGIGPPTVFAVRGGVKAAIEGGYDVVVLDMDTPGGRLDSTLEIMEILDRFPGKTMTFVNDEAISAGAIISVVTDEIYFTPKAVIGSAEPVTGQGKDINESMKRKLMSYLNSKMEAYTSEVPFRSDVIRAMMDPDFEFKIGDEVISEKGQLLNLSAKRAHEVFGDPPTTLLGSGIAENLDQLLSSFSAEENPKMTRFEATWSLNLAQFIVTLAPLLLAIAAISVYVEFQTPGFGVFGIVGVLCFLIAIFGHNVAGLSGHEPMLLFMIGITLLCLEIFVAPGTLFFAIPGVLVMVFSLIWAMTDIWPAETPDFHWNWAMFERPLQNLMGGGLLGIVIILVLARFLPKTFIWDRLVLKEAVGGAGGSGASVGVLEEVSLVGSVVVASTDLKPGGEVELDGKRYEARLSFGSAPRGATLRVVARADFGYIVEEVES